MIPIITGSDGYIGSTLKQVFKQHNQPFVGFDRKSGPDLLSAEGRLLFEEAAANADAVIHLAALPRVPASWTDTASYIRDNIELTEYVSRICEQNDCHLIFASSSSVYGDGNGPLNPYAWTKQASEDLIRIYGQNNLKYTIFRIFTTYGNGGQLVLDKWIRQRLAGEPITLQGDGNQSRDFIHVEDVAHALYSAYLAKLDEETFDIGHGTSNTLNNLLALYGGEITREPARLGDTYKSQAKAQRTMELLNWAPKYDPVTWIRSSLGS